MSFEARVNLWYYLTGAVFMLFMKSAGVDFWTGMLGFASFVMVFNPILDAVSIIVRNDKETRDEPM